MLSLLDFQDKVTGIWHQSFLSMRDLVTRSRPLTPGTIPKFKNRNSATIDLASLPPSEPDQALMPWIPAGTHSSSISTIPAGLSKGTVAAAIDSILPPRDWKRPIQLMISARGHSVLESLTIATS